MRLVLGRPEPSICIDNVNLEGMIVAFKHPRGVHVLVGLGHSSAVEYAFHPSRWDGTPIYQTNSEQTSVRDALKAGEEVYVFSTDKKFLEWVN